MRALTATPTTDHTPLVRPFVVPQDNAEALSTTGSDPAKVCVTITVKDKGSIIAELEPEERMPVTVANFLGYVKKG